MEALAGLPNVVTAVVPHAKLAVHEEFPDEVKLLAHSYRMTIGELFERAVRHYRRAARPRREPEPS